jgi:N-acetylmuramoyl-L-alanine amidase
MIKKINAFVANVCLLVLIGFFSIININAQISPEEMSAIKTVVIDAGHGGKDPGCHGALAQEKHVCLSMALKLGALIKKNYPHINVVYTRSTDVFVELDDRAKIANKANADLFICIHANAAGPTAVGTETYVLGLHKTEAQQKIAERENAAILLEDDRGEKYKTLTPDDIIAQQLQLSVYLDQAISFATKLQAEFTDIGRYDRGVKQAGFLVLYKTTMPSVLIETGFLTNPEEEKFLNSEESQTLMANSMFAAFKSYKDELEGVVSKTDNKPIEKKEIPIEKKEIPVEKKEIPEEKKKVEDVKTEIPKKGVIEFRVQIETSDRPIGLNDAKFKGVSVKEYRQDNLYKYTTGNFENDIEAAKKLKNEMTKKGFQHAFVVAFMDGERISIEKAIKLAEK